MFAYDDKEQVEGKRWVAAAITDRNGNTIVAGSIKGPRSRMRENRFTEEISDQIL